MIATALVVFASLGGPAAQSFVDGPKPETAQVEHEDQRTAHPQGRGTA